jgi:hypothetical protein
MIYQNFSSPLDWTQSFIFTHIPKCAGSSLNIFLEDTFADDYKIFFNNALNDDILGAELLMRSLKGAGGHFQYGLNPLHLYRPESVYFTILRDPIERVISFYNYVLNTKNHYLHTIFPNLPTLSVNEFFMLILDRGDENLIGELSDTMAKMLAPNISNAKDAIAFIQKSYSIVGTQNRLDLFENSIRELFLNYKCSSKPLGLENVTENKICNIQSLEEKVYNNLLGSNRLDMEIYDYFSKY